MRLVTLGLIVLFGFGQASAAEKATRFWNLTSDTVTSLRLAPTGTTSFGPDLAKIDSDGAVDHDERLAIKDLPTGTYDVSIGFKSGRSCAVKGLKIEAASIFSIEEKDLSNCAK